MKTCENCKIDKEITDFNKSKKWRTKICKDCANEKRRNNYQLNRDAILKYSKDKYLEKKDSILKTNKNYRDKNKEFLKLKQKQYVLNNKERISEYQKRYRLKNKEKLSIEKREWQKNKSKTDNLFVLKRRVRWLVYNYIKKGNYIKSSKTTDILGCDFIFFKEYIESQFKPGMNWDNIHLDHIKPLSKAKSEKEILEFNHYTNFQPLFVKENLKKSNKLIEKQLRLI